MSAVFYRSIVIPVQKMSITISKHIQDLTEKMALLWYILKKGKVRAYHMESTPKHIRQIGEVQGNYKVYLEDYVATFIQQLRKQSELHTRRVVLIGNRQSDEEQVRYLVYGAIACETRRMEEGELLFSNEEQGTLQESARTLFPACEIIGWAVLQSPFNGISKEMMWSSMEGAYEKEGKLLLHVWEDEEFPQPLVCEQYTAHTLKGFQIFYEKNEGMQQYLIQWNQFQCHETCENENDDTTQRIRTYMQAHGREKDGLQKRNYLSIACMIMAIMISVSGVCMLNNYKKMKNVEVVMNHLVQTIEMDMQARNQDVEIEEIEEIEEVKELEEIPTMNQTDSYEEQIKDEVDSYYVVAGDTLEKISMAYYEQLDQIEEICALNNIHNPDNIQIGQKILLP